MHSRALPLLLLLAPLTLSACVVGPDYELPSLDLPSSWHEGATKPADTATRDPNVSWWKDFNDPVLNDLVERALANNEDLKVAAARVIETRGLRESTASKLYPEVGAGADANRGDPGAATTNSILSTYQGTFDASWEIDVFGGTQRRVEAADAQTGMAEAAYRNASLTLAAEVAREYITLRQLQAQLAVTRETADVQHHLYAITQDHYKGGLVSTLDVAQSETLYKSTRARMPDFERQVTASAYRLSVLLGENPGSTQALIDNPKPVPVAHHVPVLDAPATILRQRPDIAQAERQLAANTALQGVAISQLYPHLSLSALFGIQRGTLPVFDYAATNQIWNLGASVSMPILEFGSIEGQINAADARQVQAFHQYKQTVLRALSEVETNLSNLNKESQRQRLLTDAGKSADYAVGTARDRYRNGLSDFTSVLQVEQQRFTVQLDVIASQSAVAQNMVALHKSLGENPAPVTATPTP